MKKTLILSLLLLFLFSCQQKEKKFTIQGSVLNAEGKILILEHTALTKTVILDSLQLSAEGKFSFESPRPEYPDFYQLRIDQKTIKFAVDSTETITINANYPKFATDYEVDDSPDSEDIKILRQSVIKLQRKINAFSALSQEEKIKNQTKIQAELEEHKALAHKIILRNTRSTGAYFALFQQINGLYIFSPYDSNDYIYYAAVASAYHAFMPEYERSKQLYNSTLIALKERKEEKEKAQKTEQVFSNIKKDVGYIDIVLPNKNGKERKLSELIGKVVLIDFSNYELKETVDHTFFLRELHRNYQDAGFEIYQVCLDQNRLLWEIATEKIPWICVRENINAKNSFAKLYNIQSLPSFFLMDKTGTIIGRNLAPSDLVQKIEQLIK